MNIAKMTSRTYVNEHQGRCQPNLLHGGQPVTVWAVGPEPVQRGGRLALACLLFDVLEAAAFEQLAVSVSSSKRSKAPVVAVAPGWDVRVCWRAAASTASEDPGGPGQRCPGRQDMSPPGQEKRILARYGKTGGGYMPLGGDKRCGRSLAGWIMAPDAKVGDHVAYGCVAWLVFRHCQRGHGPTASTFTLL